MLKCWLWWITPFFMFCGIGNGVVWSQSLPEKELRPNGLFSRLWDRSQLSVRNIGENARYGFWKGMGPAWAYVEGNVSRDSKLAAGYRHSITPKARYWWGFYFDMSGKGLKNWYIPSIGIEGGTSSLQGTVYFDPWPTIECSVYAWEFTLLGAYVLPVFGLAHHNEYALLVKAKVQLPGGWFKWRVEPQGKYSLQTNQLTGCFSVYKSFGPLRPTWGERQRNDLPYLSLYQPPKMLFDAEMSPLHECVQNSDITGLVKLLEDGYVADVIDGYKRTSLHEASALGETEMAYQLIKYGASVNACDMYEGTPLHEASAIGNIELVEILLASGARINVVDEDGNSPILLAIRYGHSDLVVYLEKCGAEIDMVQLLSIWLSIPYVWVGEQVQSAYLWAKKSCINAYRKI